MTEYGDPANSGGRYDHRSYRYGEFGDGGMWLPFQCPRCSRVKWSGWEDIACATGHAPERMREVPGEPAESADVEIEFLS